MGYRIRLPSAATINTQGGMESCGRDADGTPLTAVAFLAVFSLPPSLAALSLDRRPSLLTLASMTAVVQGVAVLLTMFGVLFFLPDLLWYWAARRRPRPAVSPRGPTWLRPLLAVAGIAPLLAMTMHLDPICTVVDDDGALIREYEYEGAPRGWSLQLTGSSSSSSTSNGMTTTCHSNTIVAWEPILSIVLSAGYLALVWWRWPTAQDLAGDPASIRSAMKRPSSGPLV